MAAPFDKSEIIDFFLVEAGEHIQNLNAGLLALEKDPVNRATIDELFRAAHTLKGSAAMMGFQGVSDAAHKALPPTLHKAPAPPNKKDEPKPSAPTAVAALNPPLQSRPDLEPKDD